MLYGAPPVTPFAGVWIEIGLLDITGVSLLSLPSRECGLKCSMRNSNMQGDIVTPFAGVWIEIDLIPKYTGWGMGHSLRGSVD